LHQQWLTLNLSVLFLPKHWGVVLLKHFTPQCTRSTAANFFYSIQFMEHVLLVFYLLKHCECVKSFQGLVVWWLFVILLLIFFWPIDEGYLFSGHFVEAQILEAIGVDYIDESEVLTPADDAHHINKHNYRIPFVCGCRNLGEALRRIAEGAAMIRTKGEAGTGNVVEAVRHTRSVLGEIRRLQNLDDSEVFTFAKEISAPYELVRQTKNLGRLPVVNFAAGGVATPADAALMMQLGCDGVFVGSGIFKSGDPAKRARAIVEAVTHYNDAHVLAEVSTDLGEAMVGINLSDKKVERFAARSE
jgi:pyridoxal 5'-phosphate synthase subunit Pdx1